VVSDRGVEGDHGGWIVVGWVLAEALVRPMVVEMLLPRSIVLAAVLVVVTGARVALAPSLRDAD
jgi:hypothetical protein